jgi:hypothetical protein
MVLAGAMVIGIAMRFSISGLVIAGLYIVYGIGGAFWIIYFLCPHCCFYGTNFCPCGYGKISAMMRKPVSVRDFRKMFRRHIPVIVPLWFIPPVVALSGRYSLLLVITTGLFILVGFVILPLVSRHRSCSTCGQKDNCPWMTKKL